MHGPTLKTVYVYDYTNIQHIYSYICNIRCKCHIETVYVNMFPTNVQCKLDNCLCLWSIMIIQVENVMNFSKTVYVYDENKLLSSIHKISNISCL